MSELRIAAPGHAVNALREQLMDAFADVLDSGSYILGRQVEGFEQEWAAYCGCGHAVGVSSGTDALALALRAVGVTAGDEVLVPAMTATATWAAVAQLGAVPVGVDIEPEGKGIDPQLAARAISERTRALVVVHLFGQAANIDGLLELSANAGLPLIEDAAQAHGARWRGRSVGTLGTAASFSFYPTKNLGAIGDAGMVTTGDASLAEKVRALREYGWNRGRAAQHAGGVNARLDELQAAFLRVMLGSLEAGNERRREIAGSYLACLAGAPELELPRVVAGSEPVWHQFVVQHPRRDHLARSLGARGIQTAIHYARLPALEPAFAGAPSPSEGFPVAERHASHALSVPVHPGLCGRDVALVGETLAAACEM